MDHRENDKPVIVIGAGLSGLSCAASLHAQGIAVRVVEAADRVGGRVVTDVVDGFKLDRGFQVLLTAYPEAMKHFDYEALDLHAFYPGALIQVGEQRYRFADPWKKPFASLPAIFAPIATIGDAIRIAKTRSDALRDNDPNPAQDTASTDAFLRQRGLSQRVIERFFRPFFGGVMLDRELSTPSSFFRFVFSMFARGPATLPAAGMQALPEQLAAGLPAGCVMLNTAVSSLRDRQVVLASGETLTASAVVMATDADAAARLAGDGFRADWNSTTTVYYAADSSPLGENILLLNGNGQGLVNHICVPSDVCASYAPVGQSLISVSIVGPHDKDDAQLDASIRGEMASWFKHSVADWRFLRAYRISKALPRFRNTNSGTPAHPDGRFVCGDHVQDPSINGALLSGRTTSEAVIRYLQ